MPNWLFSWDAIRHGRVRYREVQRLAVVSAHTVAPSHLTHRDMGNVIMM
ncbi:hypothetical protein [uncultured Shewanella sp.]|nr:hypothetical protein [uncultured Shewanella sp.]